VSKQGYVFDIDYGIDFVGEYETDTWALTHGHSSRKHFKS